MPDLGSVANSWMVRRPNRAGQQRLGTQLIVGLKSATSLSASGGAATANGGAVTSSGTLVLIPDDAIMAPMMAV